MKASELPRMDKIPRKLTLDDLAVQLQLSKFSISRALRGNKGVSKSTREYVLKAVRELGYEHAALRPAAQTSERQIRLIIPRDDAVDNPFWLNVIGGAEAEARRLGFTLVTVMAEDGYLLDEESTRPTGIILAGRRARGRLESYLTLDIPMVLIGYPKPDEAIDAVHVAHWEAGFLIGRHLHELGHSRIAYVTDEHHDVARSEKLRGCRDAYEDRGPAEVREVSFDPERETDIHALGERLLATDPPPSAIVCATEMLCFKVLLALSERGLRVPDDISVVGSNNSPRTMQLAPHVTTISAPMREIGSMAMSLLERRMAAGKDIAYRRVALKTTLNIRSSSGRAR